MEPSFFYLNISAKIVSQFKMLQQDDLKVIINPKFRNYGKQKGIIKLKGTIGD
jgi:hypothetical protein